jgi:hypothetical protein
MSRLSLDKAPEQKRQTDTASSKEKEHAPQPSNLAQDLLALQRTAGNQAVTHVLQRAQHHSSPGAPMSEAPSIVHEVLRSPGQPLAAGTRAFMEARFGYDLSQVRVHTDAQAAESARAVNALAYTVGHDVVFGAGQYAPEARAGKRLIAHELSHVIQQQNTPGVLQGKLSIGSPSDSAELAADTAARAVMLPENSTYRSSALQIRRHLRRSSLPFAIMQRAVKTWGGEFDTVRYERSTKDQELDGVKIILKFVPNERVDAELIGMVQTVNPLWGGVPIHAGSFEKEEARQKAFEGVRVPIGEGGEGTKIDMSPASGNPLYATGKPEPGHRLEETPTKDHRGQHGWRYKQDGVEHERDAWLIDTPRLGSHLMPCGQFFETTALAIKGVQKGTFYGSVEWGWKKDADGHFTKLPLMLGSKDVPSRVFGRASELWNISETSQGEKHIPLPVGNVQFSKTQGVLLVNDPLQSVLTFIGELEKNTRLQVLDTGYGKPFNKPEDELRRVIVLKGPLKGKVGWVHKADLSDTMTR